MRFILQFPFLHEKVVHGPRYEEVRVCRPTKICLKPDGNQSQFNTPLKKRWT